MTKAKIYMLVFFIFLIGILFLVGSVLPEELKRKQAAGEVRLLAKACQDYERDSVDAKPPANLGQLLIGLSAADAIGGAARSPYIAKKDWTISETKDPWGNNYIYDAKSRTISYTISNGIIKTISF